MATEVQSQCSSKVTWLDVLVRSVSATAALDLGERHQWSREGAARWCVEDNLLAGVRGSEVRKGAGWQGAIRRSNSEPNSQGFWKSSVSERHTAVAALCRVPSEQEMRYFYSMYYWGKCFFFFHMPLALLTVSRRLDCNFVRRFPHRKCTSAPHIHAAS